MKRIYWIIAIPLTALAGAELATGIQASSGASVLGSLFLLALAVGLIHQSFVIDAEQATLLPPEEFEESEEKEARP